MENDANFMMLVLSLKAKLGRLPTEDEVVTFINGMKAERQLIWDGKYGESSGQVDSV
jgi:hypothetical protein